VKFGQVEHLEIQSNFRQFAINDHKYLNVVGYDSNGNIFSELDGFRLDWTITEGSKVIKQVQTTDPKMRHSHQTDVFFVKGTTEGSATVAVKLIEPGYEHIKVATIDLRVMNPIVLLPSEPVYILPTS
jgi:hypothetical protein